MFYKYSLNPKLEIGRMSDRTKNIKAKKKIILESFVVFLIAMVPIFFKLYDYLPGPNDENAFGISLLGIDITNNGFDSVATNVWFYTGKIVPLMLCVIWFFSSKDWWYHIIIIPIATFAFQLFELMFSEDDVIDTENIWWLLPVCMVVIPFVYFIRVKLYDKHVHGIDLEAMDAELQELKQKPGLKETKNQADRGIETLEKDSLSEEINRKLSTGNLENMLKQLQHRLQDWLHLKF